VTVTTWASRAQIGSIRLSPAASQQTTPQACRILRLLRETEYFSCTVDRLQPRQTGPQSSKPNSRALRLRHSGRAQPDQFPATTARRSSQGHRARERALASIVNDFAFSRTMRVNLLTGPNRHRSISASDRVGD
jgi:hypothetical protein